MAIYYTGPGPRRRLPGVGGIGFEWFARTFPYYVEFSRTGVYGYDELENAIWGAKHLTIGTYHFNGVLSKREAKIFENGGKLLETIKGGFTESEYNRIKEMQENEGADEEETVSVQSFKWSNSFKM